MFREDLYDVTVTVTGTDGRAFSATFDKMDGGDVTAKETKYRAGNGTEDEQTLGGSKSVSNITVSRLYDDAFIGWTQWLLAQTGRAKMVVKKQPIDDDGHPYGDALVYTGKLNATKPPKTDSESDAAAVIELEQSSVTPVA